MQTHSFHIPVMGTGFTVDTPLKVARYGISSVISLVDDKLLEKIRHYYCAMHQEKYDPIPEIDMNHRARRVTEYLNFVGRIVTKQVKELKESPFEEESEISKYFEMLDDNSYLKRKYIDMLYSENPKDRLSLQTWLRERIVPGSIDINIMTKADRENTYNGEKLPKEYSDAMAALRGFAESDLNSSVVFSAGLNLHLYSYVAEFDDFYADEQGTFKKKITLKVSDFRSAFIQAKIFAKKGIWVSEYRIESGLNCGGHAFATTGHLMGPILEEFKLRKKELVDSLFLIYRNALIEKKKVTPLDPPPVLITAQGGVGTSAEHQFLFRYYELDSVGWGSPFLLVPEATTVDNKTLAQLINAGEGDIYLSNVSPLGIPFYNLRNSSSEEAKQQRINSGTPGSPCLSKFLAFNTEYGTPLCVASNAYQKRKLEEIKQQNLSDSEYAKEREKILEKSCICRDLGDGALLQHQIPDKQKKELTPAVCPGPNLAYFSKICSLKEMVDHIYGRINILDKNRYRSHVFINELRIYIHYLKGLILKTSSKITTKETEYFSEFRRNLADGIEYYKNHVNHFLEESESSREKFLNELTALMLEMEELTWANA